MHLAVTAGVPVVLWLAAAACSPTVRPGLANAPWLGALRGGRSARERRGRERQRVVRAELRAEPGAAATSGTAVPSRVGPGTE
jgi:hypothetical protein